MRNIRIDDKHEFQPEKKVVVSELNGNEDNPWDLEYKAILPMLWPKDSPYSHPVIGQRWMTMLRVGYITLVFNALAWTHLLTGQWAALYYFVLWIVPNEAIYAQTKRQFTDRGHPYRQMLDVLSGNRTKLLEKQDRLDVRDRFVQRVGHHHQIQILGADRAGIHHALQ